MFSLRGKLRVMTSALGMPEKGFQRFIAWLSGRDFTERSRIIFKLRRDYVRLGRAALTEFEGYPEYPEGA